jgi:predicted SAM-dependent methyltransferase
VADKAVLWDALYRGFIHRYVDYSDTVLDLAVGSCEFINAARVRRKIDVVFTSNFFEHLPDKRVLLSTLAECHRVLRLEGLRLAGCQTDEVIPRFVPYTVKTRRSRCGPASCGPLRRREER